MANLVQLPLGQRQRFLRLPQGVEEPVPFF